MSGERQPGQVTEVEFSVTDADYPFVRASRDGRCRFDLVEMVPRKGEYAEFFRVAAADPERVLNETGDREGVDARLLATQEGSAVVEFVVSGNCPAVTLAELGALPRTVTGVDGEGRIVAEVPPRHDAARVAQAFVDEHPEATVTAKHEKEQGTPIFGLPEFRQVVDERLTDRQREVLEAAFEAGYYEWPRECTGAEVAEELGISSATFSQHVHTAERKLLTLVFE